MRPDIGDQAIDRGSVLGGNNARDSASYSSVVARGGSMPEPHSVQTPRVPECMESPSEGGSGLRARVNEVPIQGDP
eukprot:9944139-Alexandrium_andersonii.AAC.1